jgi:ferredoxin
MAKKVKVNKDMCVGCGACTAICGDVFALGDDGLAEAVAEATEATLSSVEDAASSCPVGAIELD